MELKSKINELEEKKEFKEWKLKNRGSFISFIMMMIENPPNQEVQIGYFNKGKNNITTFVINNGELKIDSEEEIFKREEDKVNELDIGDVRYTMEESAKIAENFQEDKYPGEKPTKIISILQNLSEVGTVWNFTFITRTMSTLNIKVGAKDGQILKHSLTKLFEFK